MKKKLLAFAVLLTATLTIAFAADKPQAAKPADNAIHVGGFWTPTKNGPFVVMNGGNERQAFLGLMRSTSSKGCEFAISVDKDGVQFQIMDENGKFHFLPATALLKLADKKKTPAWNIVAEADCDVANEQPKDAPKAKGSDAPVAGKDDIPAGHRLLYKMARIRAAGELADKEKISRRAAREKIDDAVTDAQLHELATAAGIAIKPQVSGGKVQDFLDWLIAHQDVILALVKILLALFQVDVDADNSTMFQSHDWCGQLFALAA